MTEKEYIEALELQNNYQKVVIDQLKSIIKEQNKVLEEVGYQISHHKEFNYSQSCTGNFRDFKPMEITIVELIPKPVRIAYPLEAMTKLEIITDTINTCKHQF